MAGGALVGNSGRNAFYGPGIKTVDFSTFKNYRLTEQARVQFRAEFFNILNHPNFAAPNVTLGSGFVRSIHAIAEPGLGWSEQSVSARWAAVDPAWAKAAILIQACRRRYSCRNAASGSIRSARRAGKYEEASDTRVAIAAITR